MFDEFISEFTLPFRPAHWWWKYIYPYC